MEYVYRRLSVGYTTISNIRVSFRDLRLLYTRIIFRSVIASYKSFFLEDIISEDFRRFRSASF